MSTSPDIYALMQKAVDVVQDSPHPDNKVAACLSGQDTKGKAFHITSTNYWPAPIAKHIGTVTRIGNSSGTVHAEMACISKAPCTRNARLFVTDPPCPNCTKYLAEAGISEIYIDHKGFHKDFAARRGDSFENMSLRICQRAGIKVFEIWRKEQRTEIILDRDKNYKPPIENPAIVDDIPEEYSLGDFVDDFTALNEQRFDGAPYAFCLAQDGKGKTVAISANVHPIIGYTSDTKEKPDDKYSFNMQPINRLITNAARKGVTITPGSVFSSRVPTAREQINFIGAGLQHIMIGDRKDSRDEHGLTAFSQLRQAGVITLIY